MAKICLISLSIIFLTLLLLSSPFCVRQVRREAVILGSLVGDNGGNGIIAFVIVFRCVGGGTT